MRFKNIDKIIHSFLEYLEERSVSILDYADIIIPQGGDNAKGIGILCSYIKGLVPQIKE